MSSNISSCYIYTRMYEELVFYNIMVGFLKYILTFSIFFLVTTLASVGADVPAWHMKPLGSHTSPGAVDETFADSIISPTTFANEYVLARRPIVFRNVVKEWPAFELWTDEYLAEKYGDLELRIEGKKEKESKIPKGDVCLGRDRMRTFLKEYKQGADKYVVSELPTPMWKDVMLPAPTSCGELLNSFVEIDLWMNSDLGKKGEGGSSILHKDAFNTINCVVSGKKDWKLIELKYNDNVYQSWEGAMDRGYGGFSLVNPEKVDANRFPKVGETPWQLTTVHEGDCIYLPSQMWHQVKSYGEVNRAVAFLFSQFNDRNELNTSDCKAEEKEKPIVLTEVDVDLQYPGTGKMYMGNSELSKVIDVLRGHLVDKKKGHVTKRSVYTIVNKHHQAGHVNLDLIKKKTIEMYEHFLLIAGGVKRNMNQSFVDNLTRDQVRPVYLWMFLTEPSSCYEHEYSYLLPESLIAEVSNALEDNGGLLSKEQFMVLYQAMGGTEIFAQEFWYNLADEAEVISDISQTIDKALEKYEYFRRETVDDDDDVDEDGDDVIVTPQGHQSRPKREMGGYSETPQHKIEKQEEELKDEL